MAYEIYISVIAGLIVGWLLKTVGYGYSKKALRDKKYLEGRISAYLDFYEWTFKANVYSGLYFQYLKDNNKDKIEYYSEQIENLHQKEFPKVISKVYFYTDKNVEKNIYDITNKIETMWKEGNEILLPSVNSGKVTTEQVSEFQSFIMEIDKASDNFLKTVRVDLGFEKKSKKKV